MINNSEELSKILDTAHPNQPASPVTSGKPSARQAYQEAEAQLA
jgi:hypothetical protein